LHIVRSGKPMDAGHNVVEFLNVGKAFGAFEALSGVNLSIRRGEIVTLLGPSGCGKTTLMRILAGFETLSRGRILINGDDVERMPPERRPVNMVFQRYALFPHLDVFDNVAFGLRLKRLPESEVRSRTLDMLKLVQLSELGNRWTTEISGGQAQRVALARALVNRPSVLLLDEPLAALDLKIRQYMVSELKRIHRETATTFLYVTHDQDEAMMLSDRIVLMNKGKVEQMDAPEIIYATPKTRFAATFLGDTNIIPVRQSDKSTNSCAFTTDIGTITSTREWDDAACSTVVSIRPETIQISRQGADIVGANLFDGKISSVMFVGSRVLYEVEVNGRLIKCQEHKMDGRSHHLEGDAVSISWSAEAVVALSD
jgi:spermidine/putrescine transport system ATP-binding protein